MSKNYVIKKFNNSDYEYLIAEIINKNTKKRIGVIMYEPMLRYKTGNQAQVEHYKNKEDEDVAVITINNHYKKLFDIQPNLFEGVVMHEIGHLINGDYKKSDPEMEERGDAILNDEVDIRELKADEFAVEEVGKKRFIKYLEWAIENRRNLENDHPNYKQMAIQEFENRIRVLKGK